MIREYSLTDRQEMLALFQEFYNSDAVLHKVPETNFSATLDEAERSDVYAVVYLMIFDGTIAGYALLNKCFSNEAGGYAVWLEELYIRPYARGRGLGKEFLSFMKEKYSFCKRLRLETEPDNVKARRLYENYGFVPLAYTQYVLDK